MSHLKHKYKQQRAADGNEYLDKEVHAHVLGGGALRERVCIKQQSTIKSQRTQRKK